MSRRNSSLRLCALLLGLLLLAGVPTAIAQSCVSPGTDGPGTISGIVNTYYPASTATETINAGATSIALGSASGNAGSTTPIAVGDLVLIIQMQDAIITATNGSAYGTITSSTAGYYEFAVATSAVPLTGGTLTTSSGVTNAYHQAAVSGTQGQKRFQVVRVPQYASVTL